MEIKCILQNLRRLFEKIMLDYSFFIRKFAFAII